MLKTLSLKLRLPFYVSTAMAVVLAAVAWSAYLEVRGAGITAAHERLQRVAGQLAELTALGGQARVQATADLARDPSVVGLLTDSVADRGAARARLQGLADSIEAVAVAVRDRNGLRVLSTGDVDPMPLGHSVDLTGGARTGALLDVNGVGHYAIAAPVLADGAVVGSVYAWRVAARLDEAGRRVLGDLIGSDATILLGSLGGAWSDLSSLTPPPPLGLDPGDDLEADRLFTYTRPAVGEVFAHVQPLPGTAWYLVVELPVDDVLGGARTFLLRLLILLPIGLALVGLVAWGAVRTITRSLVETTIGAEALAAGERGYRVPVTREDELGRLARSFNSMAQQIEDSQEALRDLNASLRTMLDGAPLPIIVVDREHVVRLWNKASERTFGWSADSVIGHRSPLRADGGGVITLGTDPRGSGREYRTMRQDGQAMDVFIAHAPTYAPDGRIDGTILVCEDITARKRAEAQLERYAERLSRSNQELENFAYVASHDLREPLRMVRSFTGLLAERYSGQLDDEAEKYIRFAVEGATRMERLIRALLEYSRVDGPRESTIEVSTDVVVADVIQLLSPAIAESNAVVTADPLPAVVGDPDQLLRLFQNLIGNGIKFCRSQPQVHVSAVQRGDECVFCVKDNGIGINPDYYERIFEVFRRLHGLDEFGGTGIGLAICKKIVERHGGRIWVESMPDRGSSFYFSLPAAIARVA